MRKIEWKKFDRAALAAHFLKHRERWIAIGIGLCATACISGGILGSLSWNDRQAVFHDVVVELGTESVSLRDFMTERAIANRCGFVSDPGSIDLAKTGTTELVLRSGSVRHNVVLTVQDTIAPAAVIDPEITVDVANGFLKAKDLVQDVQDAGRVSISYAQKNLDFPEDYADLPVTLVLTDDSGNETRQDTLLHFTGWVKPTLELEYGDALTADLLLTDPDRDLEKIEVCDHRFEQIASAIGQYSVPVVLGNSMERCTVVVQDTTAPKLKIQDVRINKNGTAKLEDFLISAEDLSGEAEVWLVDPIPEDLSEEGIHPIRIGAKDIYGNEIIKTANLYVSVNRVPPVIQGADTTIEMEKHTSPDFLEGVTATDDIDGQIKVTVDTDALNVDAAGTYYIVYSATDSSGNKATVKRKVVVAPDREDTAALVQSIADSLSDDPEAIRNYVRDYINYSHDWGGDDPIWSGFTTRNGNCYVHAYCLKAILDLKGYETQLIWVTDKSHYWLVIKLDEGWRHIDATPGRTHQRFSLMTDELRLATLGGRDWDHSAWPACTAEES